MPRESLGLMPNDNINPLVPKLRLIWNTVEASFAEMDELRDSVESVHGEQTVIALNLRRARLSMIESTLDLMMHELLYKYKWDARRTEKPISDRAFRDNFETKYNPKAMFNPSNWDDSIEEMNIRPETVAKAAVKRVRKDLGGEASYNLLCTQMKTFQKIRGRVVHSSGYITPDCISEPIDKKALDSFENLAKGIAAALYQITREKWDSYKEDHTPTFIEP